MHSEPSRLAVVTAFSLKLAAALEGAVGGSEHSEPSERADVIWVGGAVSEGFGIYF